MCRSKTVRPIDDGVGPQTDEFFTLAIGGMVTMLNNSKDPVFPGDMLECAAPQVVLHTQFLYSRTRFYRRWTFYNEKNTGANDRANKRLKGNPRRISVKVASPTSERVIGRCVAPVP